MSKFDLDDELKKLEQPDWLITAFTKTVDLSKVKSKSELNKEFKKYMEIGK